MDISSDITENAPQNNALLALLAQTDYAAPTLQQERAYIFDLDKQLIGTEARIQGLEKKTSIEKEEHERYRDSRMKRFVYRMGGSKGKEKFAARASKEEAEYFEALQAELEAKDRVTHLRASLEEAHGRMRIYERDVAIHINAQRQLDELYRTLFDGPTPQFPEEDRQEQVYAEAREVHADAQLRYHQARQAESLLSQAQDGLRRALEHVENALFHSTMDMWVGGPASDIGERDALSSAKSQALQVEQLVEQARTYNPDIRPVGPFDIAQGNWVSDVMLDNIASDYQFDKKIQASKEQLRVAQTTLMSQIEATRRKEVELKVGYSQAAEKLKEARIVLQRVRQAAFERCAASKPPTN